MPCAQETYGLTFQNPYVDAGSRSSSLPIHLMLVAVIRMLALKIKSELNFSCGLCVHSIKVGLKLHVKPW